jgi:excisionase family DNA binding protein
MIQTNTKLAYRIAELADLTGTSSAFIRKQIAEKKLSARKVGDAVIILKKDADKWLSSAVEVA